MHDHPVCEHELKFCAKCDAAYCQKCKREWAECKQNHYLSPFWQQQIPRQDSFPFPQPYIMKASTTSVANPNKTLIRPTAHVHN